MADKQPVTLLAVMIKQDDQSVAKLARTVGISERHLRRLARGEHQGALQADTRRALKARFGHPVEDLLGPPGLAIAAGDVRPDDREVLQMAARRARAFKLASAELTVDTLEALADDVRHLARAYPIRPVTELLGDLVDTQDMLFRLLEGRRSVTQQHDLLFLAGVTGGMLAKASHDLADSHSAQQQAQTAVMCAQQAGHPGLLAWLHGLQSQVAYWAGDAHAAVRYARLGAEAGATNTTAIWLPVSEARAWARLGNLAMTREAIQRAENAWSIVQPDDLDSLGGLATFSRARQLYYAADALAWLPAIDETEPAAAEAVSAYRDNTDPDYAFGDASGAASALAIARVSRGEIAGAAEAVDAVLELPVEQRINGIVSSVRRVHQAISASGRAADTEAAQLQEAIEVFAQTPLRAIGGR